jgi:acyl-CoA reductase-like NAD-dependent aldehyde dehydrogenase
MLALAVCAIVVGGSGRRLDSRRYVMINGYFTGGPGSPFGGYKQSGIGRERGLMALQNYTQVKNVVVRVGRSSSGP